MRALFRAAAAASLLSVAAATYAQGRIRQVGPIPQTSPRQQSTPRQSNRSVARPQSVTRSPVVTGQSGFGHRHGHGGSIGPYGGIRGSGSPYGYSYSPFYGYGYGYGGYGGYGLGYGGYGFGVPGGSFNAYTGPAYLGPLINPPVYTYPPFGYGATYGYGSAWPLGGPDPLNNQLLQQQYNADWRRLSARLADLAVRNQGDPRPGSGAVPIPSSPEAKIKSLRYQSQGDEAFRKQDYQQAYDRYKLAASTAKDNGAAYLRVGYSLIALGRYSLALDYFRRGLAVEPALALTGPAPAELYGDNTIAWTSHLGGVTEWVREDVRDPDRVFLLGVLLYFDGDTRAREFLEKAWQLSGGTETAVLTLLNPPKVDGVQAVEPAKPADADGATADGGVENAEAEPAQGPALGTAPPVEPSADAAGSEIELPEIPAPPGISRPAGQPPLFPLPSEQQDAASAPPLPAPAE